MCGFWSATGQRPPVLRQVELKEENSKLRDGGGGVLTLARTARRPALRAGTLYYLRSEACRGAPGSQLLGKAGPTQF